MPAPKKANTAKATERAAEARTQRKLERWAEELRTAGYTVIPPQRTASTPRPVAPYSERRPYTVADNLDNLTGPTGGVVELPHHLDWSGSPTYDLDNPKRLESMYATVLREASQQDDFAAYLNRAKLIELWPTMWLPPKIRHLWEERHPELRRDPP